VVSIPFEFVVTGKTLPAGTYRVDRLSVTNPRVLILSNSDNRASASPLSTEVENNHAEIPELSFEHVGGKYVLSNIKTADHNVQHSHIPFGNLGSGSRITERLVCIGKLGWKQLDH
jgi:hypothetical protein